MASPLHQSVRDSLPVRLGDRRYNIDPQRLQRATVDPIRQGFDTQGTPGEQSLNQAGVWKRSRTDWSLGAGQLNADLNTSSDRRFYASSGVDVWTEGEVKLLPKVSTCNAASGTTNQFLATAVVSGTTYYYWVADHDVYYSTDLTGSWTEINEPAGADAITAIASDGLNIYVASAAGSGEVQRIQGATVFTSTANTDYWAIDNVDGLWVANGYLIVSVGSRLTVLSPGTAPATSQDILDKSSQVSAWESVIGTPVGIFAAGTQGDKSRIYYIGINDSSAKLNPPVIAAELPDGETVNVISYYGSLVCIGTTRGIRLATINGQGYLSYGPVIEISGGVSYLEAQGEFIWFNWDNYDSPFDTTTRSGLGRLSLKEFTGTIVPAYATDIMVTGTTAAVQGIVTTADNRRMFSISGLGVRLENASTGEREENGYIDEGRFTWGITDLKALVSSDVRTSKLVTGDSVSLSTLSDDYAYGGTGTSTSLATSATADAVTDGVTTVTGVTGEWFAPQISMVQTANTGSPVLHRWTLRCIPMPFVSEIIELPIILTTQTRFQNRDVYHDTYNDYVYLKSLAENRSLVTFTMGGESKTVYVAGVSYAAGSISKWSDDDEWFEGVVSVQVVTVQGL
tara:strand:- start:1372 stop:3246 length:1875 start_codon:yes stop_codon:yes gene_type:complete